MGEEDLTALRETFFEEAEERLRVLESLFLTFEGSADDADLINTIFREVHSLKGGAAACGLETLANFAHVFESLLSQIRLGHLAPEPETHALMLESVDALDSLFSRARGFEARLDEGDAAMIANRIRELLGLPQSGAPKTASENELVLWLDEEEEQPVALPIDVAPRASRRAPLMDEVRREGPSPDCAASPQAHATSLDEEARHDEAAEEELGPQLADTEIARMIDLSIELAITSSAMVHALSDPSGASMDRLRSLFSDSRTHADAIHHALESIRTPSASAICEVVLVAVGEASYFLPVDCVEQYLSMTPKLLRRVPVLGEVIDLEAHTLHPVRLAHVLQGREDTRADGVAVVLRREFGPFALLVDEIVTQTRIVVRPLDRAFQRAGAVLGAAIYAGQVVLVLNARRLLSSPRAKLSESSSTQAVA